MEFNNVYTQRLEMICIEQRAPTINSYKVNDWEKITSNNECSIIQELKKACHQTLNANVNEKCRRDQQLIMNY